VPNATFPDTVERVKPTIKPVQMTGDIGDCIFTHHRILHSAGVNNGENLRLGVFTDYPKVRPTAPIAWKANGATALVNDGFSKYALNGSLAADPDLSCQTQRMSINAYLDRPNSMVYTVRSIRGCIDYRALHVWRPMVGRQSGVLVNSAQSICNSDRSICPW
jgi:hypothetical protein